jgi:hypothetical protein
MPWRQCRVILGGVLHKTSYRAQTANGNYVSGTNSDGGLG